MAQAPALLVWSNQTTAPRLNWSAPDETSSESWAPRHACQEGSGDAAKNFRPVLSGIRVGYRPTAGSGMQEKNIVGAYPLERRASEDTHSRGRVNASGCPLMNMD